MSLVLIGVWCTIRATRSHDPTNMEEEHEQQAANSSYEGSSGGSEDVAERRSALLLLPGQGVPLAPPPAAEPYRRATSSSSTGSSFADRRRIPLPPPNVIPLVPRQQAAPSPVSYASNVGYELCGTSSSSTHSVQRSLPAPDSQHRSADDRRREEAERAPEQEDVEQNSCGWSEVELSQNPVLAPSARSLHAAALLVGVGL